MQENNIIGVNEEIKKSKKKNPIGLILLVIVLMTFSSIGGYYVNESNVFGNRKECPEVNKNNNIEEKTEEKINDEQLDLEKVVDLMKNLTTANNYYCGFYKIFTDKKVTGNDLEANDRYRIVLSKLYEKYGMTEKNGYYTKEQFDKVYKEIFGSKVQYINEDIDSCPNYKYDSLEKKYIDLGHECGGTCGPDGTDYKITNLNKKDDMIELSVRVVFYDLDTDSYYSDSNFTKKIEIEKDPEFGVRIIKDSHYKQGSLYKVVFELEDENYIFKYSELVK